MPKAASTPESNVRTGAHATPRNNDWRAVQEALMRVGEHLQKPTRLVLIGSSVGMWYGQRDRMTEDVDVWTPTSTLDLADIAQACQKAGIEFNPKGYEVQGKSLYLQMVGPGVVQVGKWTSEESMFRCGNLEVVHPPAQNVIASKLVRAEDFDLDDTVYLMNRLNVTLDQVRAAVSTLSGTARADAEENIVLLDVRNAILRHVNDFEPFEHVQTKAPRVARP